MSPKSFVVNIPQEHLDDLSSRLASARLPELASQANWQYGTDQSYLRDLIAYWRDGYSWRKAEAAINRYDQFTVEIDGVSVHYLHIRSKARRTTPLILTHGWPDSVWRYVKAIPFLTGKEGDETGFDLVIPSLPGFGFSGHRALSYRGVARLWAKLMEEVLGYEKFMAGGGDMGSGVSIELSRLFPDAVQAIHLSDVGYPTGHEDMSNFSAAEREFAGFIGRWWMSEGAYAMLQSTKPNTLGFALNDSPVGLAAWIAEKYRSWSGGDEKAISRDDLLTNIMIYWFTGTAASAGRMYAENVREIYMAPPDPKASERPPVPAYVAHFEKDTPLPRDWAARKVTLAHLSEISGAGHFGAMQMPEAFASDARRMLER